MEYSLPRLPSGAGQGGLHSGATALINAAVPEVSPSTALTLSRQMTS